MEREEREREMREGEREGDAHFTSPPARVPRYVVEFTTSDVVRLSAHPPVRPVSIGQLLGTVLQAAFSSPASVSTFFPSPFLLFFVSRPLVRPFFV